MPGSKDNRVTLLEEMLDTEVHYGRRRHRGGRESRETSLSEEILLVWSSSLCQGKREGEVVLSPIVRKERENGK